MILNSRLVTSPSRLLHSELPRARCGSNGANLRTSFATMATSLPIAVAGDRDQCTSSAALRFLALVDQARSVPKRAQIGTLNRTINYAIRYVSDLQQYGVLDLWSAPLATLASGKGDCEDFAIIKLMALRELGMKAEDLRLVLWRAAQVCRWITRFSPSVTSNVGLSSTIAPRCWSMSNFVAQFTPLFTLGGEGVKLSRCAIHKIELVANGRSSPLTFARWPLICPSEEGSSSARPSLSWRTGMKGRLRAHFAVVRVRVASGSPQRIRHLIFLQGQPRGRFSG